MSATIHASDYAVIDSMTSGANHTHALHGNAVAIRLYGQPAVKVILEKRAKHRAWQEATARKWQHTSSRRAQRNNHHDSWSIRESYVRYSDSSGASYIGFYAMGHELIRAALRQGAKIKSWNMLQQSRYYVNEEVNA